MQNLENIPFVVTTGGDDIFTSVENANDIIEDANNSSMEGCVVCSYLVPTPEPLLSINQINKDTEIPLRTAANKQSQGGGQGFIKCNCNRTCQANNCKCKKNNQFCNFRCHKASKMCLNHE